jgi:RecG-like helicase
MGALRRFLQRFTESDQTRLAHEIQAWAATVPDATPIAEAPARGRVKIAGVVNRITVLPMEGNEMLEALVSDGTGEVTVVFMGRRSIPGLSLGTRVLVEGALGEVRGHARIVNPRFELVG